MDEILTKLVEGLKNKERWALGKALTLMESTLTSDEQLAPKIFQSVNNSTKSHSILSPKVIGISGAPGVGKSSFIEAVGLEILNTDPSANIFVFSVDPSSELTGGSILGDKTRMTKLSAHPRCYIRPSPSKSALGGLSPKTFKVLELVKKLHFSYIFIETVGVGQSESTVRFMCDLFCLLIAPGLGDDLQAMKRGILEHIDVAVVNKSDGTKEQMLAADLTKKHYEQSLEELRHQKIPVYLASTVTQLGIKEFAHLLQTQIFKKSNAMDEELKKILFLQEWQKIAQNWLNTLSNQELENVIFQLNENIALCAKSI